MTPEIHAVVPVAHDLPLPLPLPREALVVVLVATFILHILFVNLMVGGSVLTWIFEWLGVRRRKPLLDRIAYGICQTITVNKSLAVVLGVGPLLAMNLVYTLYFYTANAMTGTAWILVIPSVIAAFLLTYAQKFLWDRLAGRKGVHLTIGAAAVALFLFIPFIFLANINLMLFPERWGDVRGFLSAVLLPNVLPRYVHFLLASFSATALFLVWRTRSGAFAASAHLPADSAPVLMRTFYRIAFQATVIQFLAGPIVYFTLPGHGVTMRMTLVLLVGVALALLLLFMLAGEMRAPDERIGRRLGPLAALFTCIVLFMGTARHLYREDATRWHRDLVEEKTAEFMRLSAEARREAAERPATLVTGEDLGAATYAQTCAACHQPTGAGIPAVFPPLAGSEWVGEADPHRLIRILLHGLAGPVRVSGQVYSGTMPPHRDLLDDARIAAVLTFVRSSWGNQGGSVTAEQVQRVRAETAARSAPWSEPELGRPE